MPAALKGLSGLTVALAMIVAVFLLAGVLGVLPFARPLAGDVLAFLIGLSLLALVVGATLPTFEDQFVRHGAFTAMLVVSSFIFPGLAAIATLALYLLLPESHPVHRFAALPGTATGATGLVALALLFRRLAFPDRANPSVYGELLARLDFLDVRVSISPGVAATDPLGVRPVVKRHLDGCRLALLGQTGDRGPSADGRWVYGTGYIEMWGRIHRAEEDLILVDLPEVVIARAFDARLRLRGSRIANRDQLEKELDGATVELKRVVGSNVGETADSVLARGTVRAIRRAINTYRDDRWDGMVRARNRLLVGATFTGLTGFLLLALATTQGVPTWTIVAATVFYLIGALIGLFQRLYDDSRSITAIEDYGLANARLFTAPLVSGIAAVAGVVLLAMLAANPVGPASGPQSTAVPDGTAASSPSTQPGTAPSPAVTVVYPALTSIFDIQGYPFGLVVAGVFGLTPGLLLNRLRRLADQYALDLQSTEPAEGAPPT